jgi:hypothetical protein
MRPMGGSSPPVLFDWPVARACPFQVLVRSTVRSTYTEYLYGVPIRSTPYRVQILSTAGSGRGAS